MTNKEDLTGIDLQVALDERRSSTLQTSTGVHTLALTQDGRIIDHVTGEDREKFASYLSRCKYGDRRAAAILANRILTVAEHDPAFFQFIREANEAHSPVLLASHGIYYITTASKLIRDNLAGRPVSYTHLDVYKRQG